VILPLSASLAVAVFAAGIYTTASTWRASDAATRVGADLSYQVDMPLTEALALTHRLDPAGRWLMAAAAEPDPHWRKVLVDAPRLPRVGAWPSGWTSGRSATYVSRALAPGGQPVTLTGRRLRLTVDNEVRGSTDSLLFTATVVTSAGRQVSVLLGDFPHGLSTRSAPMPCTGTCRVTAMSIGGPGPFAARMRGEVTFDEAYADRTPVPHFASVGWRDGNDDPSVFGPEAVTGTRVDDGAETVQIDTRDETALAQLVPTSLPAAVPVLWGRTAAADVTSQKDGQLTIATASTDVRIHRVATTESTPFYGPSATMVDATTYTDTVFGMNDGTQVYILARRDTPTAITTGLADRGISSPTRLTDVRRTLDSDAYALALNLYAVVSVIVLLLALAGLAVNMALQVPARRRDTASLRVVGVPRRSLVAAVTAELSVVLGLVSVAGILAGALAQYVVVRTLTLGYTDTLASPRVLPSLDVLTVSRIVGITFALLVLVAAVLGSGTVRGARTTVLREDVT
jgi:hypothetical protein